MLTLHKITYIVVLSTDMVVILTIYERTKKMTIEIISKGKTINIANKFASLEKLVFAGGWTAAKDGEKSADVDLVAIVLDANNKPLNGEEAIVFYGNKTHVSGAIAHGGDNLTGAGDGDDETIKIDLTKLPAEAQAVRFIATIYNAKQKGQDFALIKDEYVRLFDEQNPENVVKFETDFGAEETFVAVDVVRTDAGFEFKAIGLAVDGVLSEYVNSLE